MADGFVLLRLSITLYFQSESGNFVLNPFSCQIALEMDFLWRTLVTFKMVSRLALSTAIRSLLSAKNKKKRTNCWFFSLCRQNGSKFSLREVTKGTKYRAFCLNTDVWYGHTGYYWIKCPILCGRSLIKEAGNQRQE